MAKHTLKILRCSHRKVCLKYVWPFCNIMHERVKYVAEKSDWNLKKNIKGCYILLHDSPARRDDYQSVTGSEKCPLQSCSTR